MAGQEQAAGGDWFDAIPLDGGRVALIVGDVVGHGVAASAAMGQLRAVLAELLAAEPDLGQVLRRTDAFAARMPALRAATLALAVLDPAGGALSYTTCGHPPPLVIAADGAARYLESTGTGPLGTGSPAVLADSALAPAELVLLYSDGLVERPDRPLADGLAELAVVAANAVANRTLAPVASPAAAERVCQLTVELLTRTGHANDVTALAAQRLAEPVPPLHLALPGERTSLTTARDAFAAWLDRLDAAAEDREALRLAMVEVFTNAIEHAYRRDERGTVELDASLGHDGSVECRVTDHGTWQRPDPAEADRGHGLMVAGQVVDSLLVSHPAADGGGAGGRGTTVTLRYRLRQPAILASGYRGDPAPRPAGPPFTSDTSTATGATARALVGGPVDITTADQLARRLLSVSRGGTVPLVADLTRVTQLASAGVRALYEVSKQLAAHGQKLVLVTAPGSVGHGAQPGPARPRVRGGDHLTRGSAPAPGTPLTPGGLISPRIRLLRGSWVSSARPSSSSSGGRYMPNRPRYPLRSPYQPPAGLSADRPHASTVPSAAGFFSSAAPSGTQSPWPFSQACRSSTARGRYFSVVEPTRQTSAGGSPARPCTSCSRGGARRGLQLPRVFLGASGHECSLSLLRFLCCGFLCCGHEVAKQGCPVPMVAVPPGPGVRAEPVPAAVLDLDPGGAGPPGQEADLHLGGAVPVPAQVPQVAQPVGRLPDGHLAPLVLGAVGGPLVDPAAHAALQDDGRAQAGHRVIGGPPGADARGPDGKCVVGRAGHVEGHPQRLGHSAGPVFSAMSVKRRAASPQTRSR